MAPPDVAPPFGERVDGLDSVDELAKLEVSRREAEGVGAVAALVGELLGALPKKVDDRGQVGLVDDDGDGGLLLSHVVALRETLGASKADSQFLIFLNEVFCPQFGHST
ncbi:MAG: hypothetical protein GY812_16610 [Actinomycetia bacterium]|nr:hypothetical protein [Actinomycetes bacterium]